jgi:hypothetical protein
MAVPQIRQTLCPHVEMRPVSAENATIGRGIYSLAFMTREIMLNGA